MLDETKSFNKNFELYFAEGSNNELIFTEFVKIDPRKVSLNLANIIVEDKVEDGLKNATLSLDSQFNLSNVVAGEELYIVPSKVTAVFDSETVGTNKTVTIDPTKALGGVNSTNYYIETSTVNNKVIYPYSIALEIAELGTFVLYNERGVTDATKANLIPIGSKLVVEVVNPETGEFVEIYDYIEKYLSTTKVFSVAYRVSLEVYNIKQPISNELFISVPYNSEVTQVIFLTGEETIEMPFAVEGNNVVIDLATLNLNVDTIVLLEKRALLKLWQIVLIVAGGVVVLGGIATAVVIIRIRKNRKNELLEKI